MVVQVLEGARVGRAKRAFTTRRVPVDGMQTLICGVARPTSGDLVIARVDEIRKQKRLELTDGRKALLFPGDEIIVCFGNRYAPDQYEAVIGDDLSSCDLVAAGGIAACEVSRNLRMIEPTRITPIGLVGDGEGNRLNVRRFSVPDHYNAPAMPTVLSVGTSMNAGKTLTATSLVRGLKAAGYRVAAIKATGTGAGNDMWIVRDAGADVVLDFTDAGFSGTYLIPQREIEEATRRLIAHAASLRCDIAIVEIADGLQHLETAALIEAKHLWSHTLGAVFAAYDAMGAKCGVDLLRALGHRVLAISGRIALSPLAMREAERATGLRVYTPWELQEGALVDTIAWCADQMVARPVSQVAGNGRQPAAHAATPPHVRVAANLSGQAIQRPGIGTAAMAPARPARSSILAFPPVDARAPRVADNLPEDLVLDLLGVVAKRFMTIEVNAICNAPWGARTAGRTNHRNGYRRCLWTTCLGDIEVRVPKLKKGGYRPAFLMHRPTDGVDLAAIAAESFAPGAPLSALARLLENLGISGPSGLEIASLQAELRRKTGVIEARSMNGSLPASDAITTSGLVVENGSGDHWNGDRWFADGQDEDDMEDSFSPAVNPSLEPHDRPGEWQCAAGPDPHRALELCGTMSFDGDAD